MGLLKKAIRKIGKLFPGTGRHAAKRAENQANAYAAEAQAEKAKLDEKTKKERQRAQKLSIRGLRSRRAASRFQSPANEGTYGSPTIG